MHADFWDPRLGGDGLSPRGGNTRGAASSIERKPQSCKYEDDSYGIEENVRDDCRQYVAPESNIVGQWQKSQEEREIVPWCVKVADRVESGVNCGSPAPGDRNP
jgi:hypothetical protein